MKLEVSSEIHWYPFSRLSDIEDNTIANGSRFVLDNWYAKYIDIRMDMRSGMFCIKEGNGTDKEVLNYLKFIEV